MIASLQYISSGSTPEEHLVRIENCCKAGVRWVQLRLKRERKSLVFSTAEKAKKICDAYGAVFLVNDFVAVAATVGANGVHLGRGDMPIATARKMLGRDAIIGGTANDLRQVENLILEGVDYIGLGPFRFTRTKNNLSPILGLQGYEKIIGALEKQAVSIPPIIAVGGIQKNDIPLLKKTGVSGVAVSGLLHNATDTLVREMVLLQK